MPIGGAPRQHSRMPVSSTKTATAARGMRTSKWSPATEVKHLRRCDVDLVKPLVHVRRSKNETSHRVIPLNASALNALVRMFERADMLGHTEPEHYLWPACQWGRFDPTNPMLKWDTAWRALRDAA